MIPKARKHVDDNALSLGRGGVFLAQQTFSITCAQLFAYKRPVYLYRYVLQKQAFLLHIVTFVFKFKHLSYQKELDMLSQMSIIEPWTQQTCPTAEDQRGTWSNSEGAGQASERQGAAPSG